MRCLIPAALCCPDSDVCILSQQVTEEPRLGARETLLGRH